jgi:exodeoxyribonuclease VII small subunit
LQEVKNSFKFQSSETFCNYPALPATICNFLQLPVNFQVFMSQKNQTFEASLSNLEKIVRRLEEGDLPLEESLKLFEDGVRLSRECQERLNQAERRIEVLLKDADGNPALNVVGQEDIKDSSPKIKRRIRFEDEADEEDDETPF